MEFFSWVKPFWGTKSCILFLYLDQRDEHSCGNFFLVCGYQLDPGLPRTACRNFIVVTSPVSHLSCQHTPHFNLLHPHSLLCTCTLHGHPDLLTPYLLTARPCRDTGEARQALRRCTVPLENLTAKRHGVSTRGGEERSDGRRETGQRNSFADSGVNGDTRPITGHGPRKETLPKLQSRESRRGSVLRLPIMGTSFESNSGYGCPDRVVLIQRAHYLPIHGMSDWRRGAITLNGLFATSVIFSCII